MSVSSVCKVISEWDIGHEDILFFEYNTARAWVRNALKALDFEESLEELEDEHLINYEWIEVI